MSATSLDIMFLGSGPYAFKPLPYKYVRPAASGTTHTAEEEEASSAGTSKGALIGIILGACCAAVAVAVVGGAIAIRRHRKKREVDGKALVSRWEAERRAADDARRAAAEARRAVSQKQLDRVLARSQKAAAAAAAPSGFDRMRAAVGLPPRDPLAVAAARVDASEAAAAGRRSAPARSSSSAGDAAQPLPAADYNASSGRPSPAPSVVSEAHTAGSEVPLTTVVVRQGGSSAPSWASRDPGLPAPPKRGFFTFGSNRA